MNTIHDAAGLEAAGLISADAAEAVARVTKHYAMAITPAMAELIDPADPDDPIAREFIPRPEELETTPEERNDPIGDAAHSPVPGIVHRHRDRALFAPALSCPVYCRFCFRRETVGHAGSGMLSPEELENALSYLEAHEEIWEVIFTGGDPLILSPKRILQITERLAKCDHIKILRWHTRVPVVLPARVSDDLCYALKVSGKALYMALHVDHPRELTDAARMAIARLQRAGVTMVSQSVLLHGVNDDIDTLEALMRAFLECGIKPYYLHQTDLARGTRHFRVPIDRGLELIAELRARVSGLCVPHYVLDIPGGFAKVPLESRNVQQTDYGWKVRDHAGVWHDYPTPENYTSGK